MQERLWTPEQDRKLFAHYCSGEQINLVKLALEIDKSPGAIGQRARRLRLKGLLLAPDGRLSYEERMRYARDLGKLQAMIRRYGRQAVKRYVDELADGKSPERDQGPGQEA